MDKAAAGFGTMWAYMASWFTPTILFCVLNLVIGTIFMASKFKTGRHQQPDGYEPQPRPELGRAPSLFERLTSINHSLYNSDPPETLQPNRGSEQAEQHPPPQMARTPSFLERLWSVNLSRMNSDPPETLRPAEAEAETKQPLADRQVGRSQSEKTTRKAAASLARMRKSGSEKARSDAVEASRQATASTEDEGVDARADDFIGRFKQQLKLQRLESFVRYRDMLNRGA
ncbi:pathogen-associated molecular patterns-induced protein A70-like [Diospyros lotus]|uniref:pathogen-associated molecular patterns-induced protein A70-like n=1 Tax=Diospyros lotus TaxID=55363 RepID=UPI0022598E77|nr:pathogen-associated molecular patterns-induced protein A70-like [Diospyros lotus]